MVGRLDGLLQHGDAGKHRQGGKMRLDMRQPVAENGIQAVLMPLAKGDPARAQISRQMNLLLKNPGTHLLNRRVGRHVDGQHRRNDLFLSAGPQGDAIQNVVVQAQGRSRQMLGGIDEAVRDSAGVIKAGTVKGGQRRVQGEHGKFLEGFRHAKSSQTLLQPCDARPVTILQCSRNNGQGSLWYNLGHIHIAPQERSMVFFELFSNNPDIVTIEAGQPLFVEGEEGKLMYVLSVGSAEVIVKNRVVETLRSGNIVGEMGIVSPGPRSATVVAKTKCEFVAIDDKRFQYLVQQTPFFATQVMRVLAERLRATDEMLTLSEDV